MQRCHQCKAGELESVKVERSVEVGPRTFVATVPCIRCSGCGEETQTGAGLEALNLAVASELMHHREVTPESFRFICRVLGVRACDVARVIGVLPDTISEWRSTRQPVDRGTSFLIAAKVLVELEGPTTVERLIGLLGSKPLPLRVHLDLERE